MNIAHALPGADRHAAIERSGWGHEVRFLQPRNPAWYLYWGLVLLGLYRYLTVIAGYAHYPAALLIAMISQVLYCLPWMWFLMSKDRYERQPARLASMAFLWGGLVATYVMSKPANGAVLSLIVKLVSLDFHNHWGPALAAPIVEESSKYVGLVLLVPLARNHIRNAYDGFLLAAFIGLGFQVFENVLYILNGAAANFGEDEIDGALRVLGARTAVGFWSHALFSAIAGSGFGYFVGATDRSMAHRIAVAGGLFLLACVIHASWDAAIGFVGFLPIGVLIGTVAIVLTWRFSERRQRDFVKVLLADDVHSGSLSAAELEAVSGRPKDRRRYLHEIKASSGPVAARLAGRVLDAAIDLAAVIASTNDPHSPQADAARAELARLRSKSASAV